LEQVGLTEKAATRTEKLSGGQLQRLAIACALVHDPEALCDRVAIMDRGRVLQLDSPAALVRGLDAPARISVALQLLPAGDAERITGVDGVEQDGSAVVLTTRAPSVVLTRLAELEVLEGLQIKGATLEDVFLNLTGREYRA
jgi:ABC-2 type transport system ATP-binding protein